MNEIEKATNKKKIVFYIIGIVVVIAIGICFVIALMNHNTNSSSVSKSSSTLASNSITKGGSYNITGESGSIVINTTDSVELVLDNATIKSDNGPAINIEAAEDVKIVLTGENVIESTTTEDLDGAIYSKADLTISGTGSLSVTSNYDGIVSKDDLIINGGTYTINATDDGMRGKDCVEITDGTFNITAGGDGIKSTNEEDTEKGYINITGGTFTINSAGDGIQALTNLNIKDGTFNIKTTGTISSDSDSAKGLKADTQVTIDGGTYNIDTTDDGIHSNGNVVINDGKITIESDDDAVHADGMVEVNGGTLNLTAHEGIEGTYVKIDDGKINISASDDGINAGNKSGAYSVKVEINGGNITIDMGQGDTDAIDSNGDIYITGGTVDITAQSPFDYDGTAKYTGGTIIVNGETTNQITNQMMGGPGGEQNATRGNQGPGMR